MIQRLFQNTFSHRLLFSIHAVLGFCLLWTLYPTTAHAVLKKPTVRIEGDVKFKGVTTGDKWLVMTYTHEEVCDGWKEESLFGNEKLKIRVGLRVQLDTGATKEYLLSVRWSKDKKNSDKCDSAHWKGSAMRVLRKKHQSSKRWKTWLSKQSLVKLVRSKRSPKKGYAVSFKKIKDGADPDGMEGTGYYFFHRGKKLRSLLFFLVRDPLSHLPWSIGPKACGTL